MTFVCLSPSRFVESAQTGNSTNGGAVGAGHPFAPEETKEEVQRALNELDFGGVDKLVLCLPGGGIAARGHGRFPEMAVEGCFIAVLSGALQNYAYLVRKYCLEELSLPTTISLEAIRDLTPVREAALLCKLYERLGTGMLTKLRGKFAFCLFDSSTMKVLAARDSTGSVPLVTGETEDGFLFVASGDVLPKASRSNSLMQVEPGQYLYGWRSSSVKYANPMEVVEKSAAEAIDAAATALKGITIQDSVDRERRRPSRCHTTEHTGQRRRAISSEPYRRAQNFYFYGHGAPDVQSWRQPVGPCPNPPFDNSCYPRRGCYPTETAYRGIPDDAYGAYREPRHLVESVGPNHRVRRPSLEPNWRLNSGENQYRRGISPEVTRTVYSTSHHHPPPPAAVPQHDNYSGQQMMPYNMAESVPKAGFKMKKTTRKREDSVHVTMNGNGSGYDGGGGGGSNTVVPPNRH